MLQLQAPQLASVCVRQATEPGLAAAVMCARSIVRDEAFALIVAEDLLHHLPNNTQLLLQQRAALPSHAQVTLLALKRATPGTTPPPVTVAGHPMGERHP